MRKGRNIIKGICTLFFIWLVFHFYNTYKRRTINLVSRLILDKADTETVPIIYEEEKNNEKYLNNSSKLNGREELKSYNSKNNVVGLPAAPNTKYDPKSVEQHLHNLNVTPAKLSNDKNYPLANVYSKKMTDQELRERLGRSTWTLLHTMAAVYPGVVSMDHKRDMLQFIFLLSRLYPCGECAQHFQTMLKKDPPKLDNHDDFSQYLCYLHNNVNKRLNKELLDCSIVDTLWDCGCEH